MTQAEANTLCSGVNLYQLRFINKSATYDESEIPVTVGTVNALLVFNGSCSFMPVFNLVYGEGLDFLTTERVLKPDPGSYDLVLLKGGTGFNCISSFAALSIKGGFFLSAASILVF